MDINVVNLDYKSLLRLKLVVDPYFCEGMKATQGKSKWKLWTSSVFSLVCADNMLSHLKLAKLSQRVEQYRHANIFTLNQEAKLGNSRKINKYISKIGVAKKKEYLLLWSIHFH